MQGSPEKLSDPFASNKSPEEIKVLRQPQAQPLSPPSPSHDSSKLPSLARVQPAGATGGDQLWRSAERHPSETGVRKGSDPSSSVPGPSHLPSPGRVPLVRSPPIPQPAPDGAGGSPRKLMGLWLRRGCGQGDSWAESGKIWERTSRPWGVAVDGACWPLITTNVEVPPPHPAAPALDGRCPIPTPHNHPNPIPTSARLHPTPVCGGVAWVGSSLSYPPPH